MEMKYGAAELIHEEFPSVSPRPKSNRVDKIRKISWDSPEQNRFIAERSENPDSGDMGPSVSGEREVARIDHDRDDFVPEEDITKILEEWRATLLRNLDADSGLSPNFIAERILKELEASGYQNSTQDREYSTQRATTILNSLSVEDLETLMRFHVRAEKEREAAFQIEIAKQKGIFLEAVRNAKASSRLPASADIDLIESRLQQLNFEGLDPLSATGPGSYSQEEHTIFLVRVDDLNSVFSGGFIKEADGEYGTLTHILVHEALHGVGGKTILSSPLAEDYKTQRAGLGFLRREETENGPFFSQRFGWLNEAATEIIAMRTLGLAGSSVRQIERQLLTKLRTKGNHEIPESLIMDAYFEDYDPLKPYGDRTPAWKHLRRSINEAYEPLFIVEFDDMIKAYEPYGDATTCLGYLDSLNGKYEPANGIKAFQQRKARELGLSSDASWTLIAKTEWENKKNH